jgi:hypothetical protein
MPELIPKNFGKVKECKVIFLNDKNLEILKGYKAEVIVNLSALPDSYPRHHASISIEITGLSNQAAKTFDASLTELSKEEITELLQKKGFHFSPGGKK